MKRIDGTKDVRPTSASSPPAEAPAWLHEKVYAPRRQRTVDLAEASIAALLQERRRISLAAIAAKSKQVDPAGVGISESALLGNAAARACYERHRTWRGTRRTTAPRSADAAAPMPIKLDRDLGRVRQRYRRWGKAALVERLLALEQAYVALEERWLGLNDELLLWQLRARQSTPGAGERSEPGMLADGLPALERHS